VPTRGPVVDALIGLGLLCGVVLALAGGIVLNGSRLLLVVMAAGAAARLGFVLRDGDRAASVDLAWKAAVGTVSVVVLVAGVVVLAGGAVAAVASGLAIVGGGTVWVLRAGRARGSAGRAPAAGDSGPAPLLLVARLSDSHPPVSILPTPVLGTDWLQTTVALRHWLEPAIRQAVVRRRQETLDELERRDPAGFARWIAAAAATDINPATFVRDDPIAGTDAA
jgi:hypothetical protein